MARLPNTIRNYMNVLCQEDTDIYLHNLMLAEVLGNEFLGINSLQKCLPHFYIPKKQYSNMVNPRQKVKSYLCDFVRSD